MKRDDKNNFSTELFPNGLVLKHVIKDSRNNMFKNDYMVYNQDPVTDISPVDFKEHGPFQQYTIYSTKNKETERIGHYDSPQSMRRLISEGLYEPMGRLEFLKIKKRHPESQLVRTTKEIEALIKPE